MYDGSPPSSFLDADFLMPVSSVVPPPIDYFVCSTPLNEIVVPFILKCGMKPVFLARVDGEGARNDANNEDEDEDNRNKSKKTKNEKSKLEKNKRVMKESEMEKEEEEEEVPPTTVSAGHTSRAVRCGRWRCFFASVNSTDNGHPLDNSLYGDNLSEGSSANKNALGGDADPFPSLTQIDHPKNKLWLGRCHARFISRLYSLLSFHSIQINSSVALALLNGENSNGVRDSGGGVWPQKLDTTSALSFFLSSSSFNTSSSRHRQRSTLVHASLFTPYDLHRLSCFSRGVLSLPFVLDLLPAVSLLLLSRQTPCVLARSEAFLLLSVALQRNPLTFAARQLGIETSQAVAKLKRACGKVVWVLHRKNVHIHSS
jgi:hypothetical protein